MFGGMFDLPGLREEYNLSEQLKEKLSVSWVTLNITLLTLSLVLCYPGYVFIFHCTHSCRNANGVMRLENYWSTSLGIADITAASITVPILIGGMVCQRNYLPTWLCSMAGFTDNLYLVASVWSIVLWSVCRLIHLRFPLCPSHIKLSRACVASVWGGAVVMALLPLLLPGPLSYQFSPHSLSCSSNSSQFNMALGCVAIIIPLCITAVTFSLTLRIARRIERARPDRNTHSLFPVQREVRRITTESGISSGHMTSSSIHVTSSTCEVNTTQQPSTSRLSHLTPRCSLKRHWSRQRHASRKQAVRGSRKTLLILSCLFVTQVMSNLPIFVLFLLIYYTRQSSLIPSLQTTTLLTTLLVCNTGFNPVIRILITPRYNTAFLKMVTKFCKISTRS